jgi:alkanesulfonate monooxygenase SsuD/methylene tetrahydromethanopterin reductase-like flavin-dependent oxidoreductase (luciferase family)
MAGIARQISQLVTTMRFAAENGDPITTSNVRRHLARKLTSRSGAASNGGLTMLKPNLAPIVILATRAEDSLAFADNIFKKYTRISELNQLAVDLIYPPLQL